MQPETQIYMKIMQEGRSLSTEDLERVDHSIKSFGKMIRDFSENNWNEHQYAPCCENEEPTAIAFIEEDLMPEYEADFPETAAALRIILNNDPHFLINGGVSGRTWRQIAINYGRDVTDEATRVIDRVTSIYDKIIEEDRETYVDGLTEAFFNSFANTVIGAALGDAHRSNEEEEDTQTD